MLLKLEINFSSVEEFEAVSAAVAQAMKAFGKPPTEQEVLPDEKELDRFDVPFLALDNRTFWNISECQKERLCSYGLVTVRDFLKAGRRRISNVRSLGKVRLSLLEEILTNAGFTLTDHGQNV